MPSKQQSTHLATGSKQQASLVELCSRTLRPGPVVSVQRHGARPSPYYEAPLPLVGRGVHDEKERCTQPATVHAHPVPHHDPSVPFDILGDKNMLQGRLQGAQRPCMGLIRSTNLFVTFPKRHLSNGRPGFCFANVSLFDMIDDFGLWNSLL